ncbi:MAG: sigma-70 family RNA polymerase sigma factor [Promicromonosporaceae bacterium]|nr:sigma-70 family RNA polymerase sigma factor [Promicromonosporaceae bacterium]
MTAPKHDWAALYQQNRKAMHGVAHSVLRKVGRPDLAQDAVQDAIRSVMEKPPASIGNPEAFLVWVTKTKALDLAKSPAVIRRADLEEANKPTEGLEAEVIRRVDLQRIIPKLRQAVAALPPRERQVIEQVVMRERSGTDVGKEMGLSRVRVSQLKKDGLRMLRERLGKETA